MNEIKLYKSPLQAFYMFIGSLLFLLMSIFLIFRENILIGWLGFLFSIFGVFVGLYLFFDKKPQIIISQKGIWYKKAIWKKHNPDNIIEWQTISRIYWASINNNKFLCLKIIPTTPKKQNAVEKNISKLNKSMGFQDTNIPLSMIKIDVNKLVDFLSSMTVANELQREYLIQNFIIPLPQPFFSRLKSRFKL